MAAAAPHPDMQAILDARKTQGVPRFSSLSIDGARHLLAELWTSSEDPEPVGTVCDFTIEGPADGVPIRIYTPEGSAPFPILVYFHGGGWVMGSIDTDDSICRALVNAAECAVVSIGYRQPPEHPFPAPVEDCYAATKWIANNPRVAHGDSARIAIYGESAGGNLAAAVAQLARDRDGPILAHQVLVTPIVDHAFHSPSFDLDPEQVVITQADLKWVWNHYLENDLDGNNPYASPLRARSLHNLPPTTVITCGFDVLRDQGITYAERLEESDIEVIHRHYDDLIHGFIGMLDDPELRQARDAIAEIGRDLQGSFGV
ncbi:alpha/beta hydrolase [Haladaptatus caseinilyticus]|uniref:alpha/beta hydrolase n=1 Tax=Haladaptatus caseinilyticus TaxID=2993314 RepID=UPI00224AED6B|nr:alpha/beta hydrolase [Haladaptatus caseinilyticus]